MGDTLRAVPRAVAVWIVFACACGRLGFDDLPPEDGEPTALQLDVGLVAGVTSLDVELCVTRAAEVRHAVSSVPWPAGWDAAYFDATLEAGGPEVLASSQGPITSCTLVTYPIAGEQTEVYVYAVADDAAETDLAEAADQLEPTVRLMTFDVNGHPQRYFVSFPESYYRDPSAPLPTLMFLHGAGEDGDDTGSNIDLLLTRSTLLRERLQRTPSLDDHPFLLIAPQCNRDIGACWAWSGQMTTLDLIHDDLADLGIPMDPRRRYLTGLSTGGEGVWNYAAHAPDRVAAIVPMASTFAGNASWAPRMCALANVAVWAFHNMDDPSQSVTNSIGLVDLHGTTCAAPSSNLSIGPGATHNIWTSVYTDAHGFTFEGKSSIFDWLLLHTR